MKPLLSISSSNYLKRILAFLLSLCCLYGMAAFVAYSLDAHYDTRSGSQKITACQLNDLYALEENSLDLLILGSSHAMCTYDPFAIEKELGLSAFNLGTALQQPDTAYYLLKEVLKTQKPKYLIYDVYFKVMQDTRSAEQATTVLKELKASSNSFSLFWDNLDLESKVSYYNNWLNPFGRIQNILENPAVKDNAPPEAYLGRGFYSPIQTVSASLLLEENHPYPSEYSGFDQRQVEYLQKVIALAEENGIQVLLTSAPVPPTILGRISYYDQILRDSNWLSSMFNVPFIDFSLPACEFLYDSDFADQGHLNQAGCAKFMNFFIEQIKANDLI